MEGRRPTQGAETLGQGWTPGWGTGLQCWASYDAVEVYRPEAQHALHLPPPTTTTCLSNTVTPASTVQPTMHDSTCHASEGTYIIPRHWQWVPMHLPLLTTVSRKQDI
jgi:hypothetical protein